MNIKITKTCKRSDGDFEKDKIYNLSARIANDLVNCGFAEKITTAKKAEKAKPPETAKKDD